MPDNRLDQAIQQIRNDAPAPEITAEAAARVSRKLFGPGAAGVQNLKSCADFQSLIPAYLQRSLSDARRMLFEDHISHCGLCRKMLDNPPEAARPAPLVMPVRLSRSRWQWAAAVAVAIAATSFAGYRLLGPPAGAQATVVSVDGVLYHSTPAGSLAIGQSAELRGGDEVRTAAGSRAVLQLADGSRVEMKERANLSVSRNWSGSTIHVDRGHIIVQAAKQRAGNRLRVSAGDGLVTVKGTIFSVNRGTVGSRISVVEGAVQVEHNGRNEALKPGDQATTHEALGRVPVEAEVSWSKDAARYLALLSELNTIQKRLEEIPANGLRYHSRLLLFTPEDTRIFTAIPNMSVPLVEAKRIFEERVRANPALRDWWQAAANSNLRREVDSFLDIAREMASYVGEEIVIAMGGSGTELDPLLMTEARNEAGLKAFLDTHAKGLRYSVRNGVLFVAGDAARLRAAEDVMARGGSSPTPFRDRIRQSYQSGAGWLISADMERIAPRTAKSALTDTNIQHLTLERRDAGGKTENRITASFHGARKGVASWIGAPSPMGSLAFVSPDAGTAAAIIVKQPRAIVEEIFQLMRGVNSRFENDIADFERRTSLRLIDDLAAPLGNEAAVAMDGPIFPNPSWKLIVEVNSPQRLQNTIGKLVELFSAHAPPQSGMARMTSEQAGGRTFYKIEFEKLPFQAHLTYVDSYLAAAATRELLVQAIRNRETGYTLPRSEKFRSQLAFATNPNFSAVVYHNMGSLIGPLADQAQNLNILTPEQKQTMKSLSESQPGVIAVHGEDDRLTVSTTGVLGEVSIGSVLGAGGIFDMLKPRR